MDDFLTVIESIRSDQADAARVFAGEGAGVRLTSAGRRATDPRYLERLALFAEVFADAVTGGSHRAIYLLKESMSTSDFPLLFGDIIDRSMLAKYRETPVTWPQIAGRKEVRDFRNVKEFDITGGEAPLGIVEQGEPYPERSLDESKLEWGVRKYGAQMPFLWEVMINDDFGELANVPERFARASRRTEEKFATELYVDANGPHASLYTAGNKNIVNTTNGAATNNPVLGLAGLADGLTVLANQRDADGQPIALDVVTLVVPPALEVTALNILNALQIEMTDQGGTASQKLIATNWMKNRVRLLVAPYYPIVASTANSKTSWHLFASPAEGRPALRMGFLRGHTEPELFMKSPNAVRVGGGDVSPMDGSFENDGVSYKVRYVLGGARIDPKQTVASNGSGS